ncbi:MAG TPA: hypothetical protein VFZ75_03825 [Actinomycetota bacterium]|nr:hypothetical protein [Actinomycetota bacterium]
MRIDFGELVPPFAIVTLELGIEGASIADRREEATDAIGRINGILTVSVLFRSGLDAS